MRDGKNVIKPWYELTEEDREATLEATTFHPASTGYFPWWRLLDALPHLGRDACDDAA